MTVQQAQRIDDLVSRNLGIVLELAENRLGSEAGREQEREAKEGGEISIHGSPVREREAYPFFGG